MYKKKSPQEQKKKVSITEHIRHSKQGQQDPRQNISLFMKFTKELLGSQLYAYRQRQDDSRARGQLELEAHQDKGTSQ